MDQILSGPTAFALHRIPPQYRALLPSVPFIGAPACWRTVLKESLFRTLIQPPLYCLRQTRSACSGAKNLKDQLWLGDLPFGAIENYGSDLQVTSPLMTLLTLARIPHVSDVRLLMAMYELCGAFSLFAPTEELCAALETARSAGARLFEEWRPVKKADGGQADSGAAGLLLQSRSSPPLPTKCARIVAERASLAAPSWSPEYARLPLRCKPLCYFRCRQNSEAKGSRGSRTTRKLSSLATRVSSRDEFAAVTETSFSKTPPRGVRWTLSVKVVWSMTDTSPSSRIRTEWPHCKPWGSKSCPLPMTSFSIQRSTTPSAPILPICWAPSPRFWMPACTRWKPTCDTAYSPAGIRPFSMAAPSIDRGGHGQVPARKTAPVKQTLHVKSRGLSYRLLLSTFNLAVTGTRPV